MSGKTQWNKKYAKDQKAIKSWKYSFVFWCNLLICLNHSNSYFDVVSKQARGHTASTYALKNRWNPELFPSTSHPKKYRIACFP